jgi:flagellar hook-associated protein 2
MAEGISVGGLASGLDTNSIINGLVAIEQRRVTMEEEKKSAYEVKLTSFNELKSKLEDFYKKAQDLDKTTAFDVFKSTSSDDTVATISGEEGAASGNYDIKVHQLASTLKVASKSFASSTDAQGIAGNFRISVSAASLEADPTVTEVQVDVVAGDSLKDIAAKINRANAGAKASVIQMGVNDYRLMLTAVDEGTKAFSINANGSGAALSGGLDLLNEATATTADKALRTNFDFKLAAGGPATAATSLVGTSLFTGIGADSALTAGDTISWTGTGTGGGNTSGSLVIGAGNTMQDLLDAINTAYDEGGDRVDVSLNDSGEIVIKDKANGASEFTLSMSLTDGDASGSTLSLGSGVAMSNFKNVVSEGKKAFYTLNDISVSAQSNKDGDTIDGTVFELKKVDAVNSVKLQLDYDKDGIKKKVQDFLDGYNQIIKYIDEKSKVEIKQNKQQTQFGEVDAKGTTIVKGPFAGDSSILGLKAQLQRLLTTGIQELDDQNLSSYASLASLGVTSEQKTGFLTIDDTRFNEALDADMEGVRRLFNTYGYMSNSAHTFGTYTKDTKTGVYAYDRDALTFDGAAATTSGAGDILNSDSGDSKGMAVKAASGSGTVTFVRGVAGQIKHFYEQITDFVGGFVTDTAKNIQKRIDDQNARIEKLEKQVSKYKSRLTLQFAQLEMAMSKLQSQSGAFQSQISSIRR